MGVELNCQTSAEGAYGDQYIKSTEKAFRILYERSIKVWYNRNEIFKVSSLYKEFKECVNVFHQITDQVIKEKRPLYENKKSGAFDGEEFEGFGRKTFIDELFKQLVITHSEWSDKDVRDEISSMVGAGSDTTAITLSKLY